MLQAERVEVAVEAPLPVLASAVAFPPAEHGIVRRRRDRGPRLGLEAMLALADAAALTVGWGLALLGPLTIPGGARIAERGAWTLAALAVGMLANVSQRLYRPWVCTVRAIEIQRLGRATVITALVLLAAARLGDLALPLPQTTAGALTALGLLVVARSWYRSWLRGRRTRGRHVKPVVLIGAGEDAAELYSIMRDHPEFGFRVAGVVGPRVPAVAVQAPWLGDYGDAIAAVQASEASGALLVASDMPASRLNDLVRKLLDARIDVHLSSGLRGIAHTRLRASPLAHEPLFYLERATLARWQRSAKRLLDLVLASILGVLALPVLAAAAVAIRLETRGPLLFRQQRIGLGGRPFTLYKLRTMAADAEVRRSDLEPLNERGDGPLFKLAADPRVTRVGRVLRATSIDELPQLFNVLTGAMSLVGPRPALPEEVLRFDDRHQVRFRVRPGISGLWQVEARDNPAFGPYRRLDLFYVENWSIGLDLSILFATGFTVLSRSLRLVTLGLRRRAVLD